MQMTLRQDSADPWYVILYDWSQDNGHYKPFLFFFRKKGEYTKVWLPVGMSLLQQGDDDMELPWLPLDFWHLSAPSTAFRLSHIFITFLEWGSKVVTSISYSESKSLHPEVSTPNRESEEPIVLLICVNYLIITVLFYNKDQQAKMSKNYSYSFIF